MQLPRTLHHRVLYLLQNTESLRNGTLQADPRWLECVERVLREAPTDAMRSFFDQFFCQCLSCDDIQYNLFLERSTLYRWRDYFLWHVALEAAQAGLLRARE